jgi:hypothetical protein
VRYRFPHSACVRLVDLRTYVCRVSPLADLSAGGAGLLLADSLPHGTAVQVGLESRRGLRWLPARVAHVAPQHPGWLHGCAFDAPLGAAELRELLAE